VRELILIQVLLLRAYKKNGDILNVLLSIKPRYATKIMEGEKKYEFRKRIFKRKVEYMYIYASSPMSKIVGVIQIEKIINGTPKKIWEKCFEHSGMTKKEYFYYFKGKKTAFAIKIKNIGRFEEPIDPYTIFEVFIPPQSFCYLNETFLKILRGHTTLVHCFSNKSK
jgi:predicted transcriptional regulator